MRKTIASFVIAAALTAMPGAAPAQTQGDEMLFSALASVSNLFYTPAKVVVATTGLVVGAFAGTLSGGDTRAAYAFWVPMAGGRYFLTADMMDGKEPVEFLGHDYTDRPSTYGRIHHGSAAYDARYMMP